MSTLITQQARALLAEVFARRNADITPLEKLALDQASSLERKAIVDVLAMEFCEKGFEATGEPNPYGLQFGMLIDVANRPDLTG